MNISGIPFLVTLTDLSTGSTLTETVPENISIYEDDISVVLWQRWIACYMLYDWNFRHAESAYDSNRYIWIQQVCKRLEGTTTDTASLKNILTDTFNHILLEDVENFIKTHMKVWKCGRLTVEYQIAKVVSEIFSGQKSQKTEKIPINPMPRKKLSEKRQLFSSILAVTGYLFYIRVLFTIRKTIQIATDKTAESCYNLRKRGMLFMANKTNTIQELNLADSFLFGKVMSDTEICRRVLEKILNVSIKKVDFPITKKTTDIAPDSGDIRLDACINDEQETIYSVEMLCCKDEELLKKARYFQCNIDSDIILPGKRCTKLKKSYIIFICTFDPFSDGRHIYTFENRCLEDLSLALGDETTEIFLSTKGEKDDVDDEIKDFLAYIENSTDACAQQTSSPLVKAIHKRVTEIKLDKDMELQYMTLLQR